MRARALCAFVLMTCLVVFVRTSGTTLLDLQDLGSRTLKSLFFDEYHHSKRDSLTSRGAGINTSFLGDSTGAAVPPYLLVNSGAAATSTVCKVHSFHALHIRYFFYSAPPPPPLL